MVVLRLSLQARGSGGRPSGTGVPSAQEEQGLAGPLAGRVRAHGADDPVCEAVAVDIAGARRGVPEAVVLGFAEVADGPICEVASTRLGLAQEQVGRAGLLPLRGVVG